LGSQQTGIELVPEVGREGKRAHDLTASEKGMNDAHHHNHEESNKAW
jgi:hypothetical protein